MARDLPNSIAKRDLLARKDLPTEESLRLAEQFVAVGALDDALAFFHKADDQAGIEKVKSLACEQGNAYLYFRLSDLRPGSVSRDDWRVIGEKALSLAKYGYAAQAFQKAGLSERLAELRAHLPPSSHLAEET